MENGSADVRCKTAASFQQDPTVRKRVLELIKKRTPRENEREQMEENGSKFTVGSTNEMLNRDDNTKKSVAVEKKPGTSQCSLCGLMYNSHQLLQLHYRRVHLKEKKHKCSSCDFHGFNKGDVHLHELRVHSNERPVQCGMCSYSTSDLVSLASHQRTHRRVKALACALCPYTCGWRHQLERHAQAHQSSERRECRVCGVVSRNHKQDLVHFSRHHANPNSCPKPPKATLALQSTKLRSILSNKNKDRKQTKPLSNYNAFQQPKDIESKKHKRINGTDIVSTICAMSSEQVSNHIQMLHASELIRNHYANVPSDAVSETSACKPEPTVFTGHISEPGQADQSSSEQDSCRQPPVDNEHTIESEDSDHSKQKGENSPGPVNCMPQQLYENIKNTLNVINVKIRLSGVEESGGVASEGEASPELERALDCLDRELQGYIAQAEQSLAAQRGRSLLADTAKQSIAAERLQALLASAADQSAVNVMEQSFTAERQQSCGSYTTEQPLTAERQQSAVTSTVEQSLATEHSRVTSAAEHTLTAEQQQSPVRSTAEQSLTAERYQSSKISTAELSLTSEPPHSPVISTTEQSLTADRYQFPVINVTDQSLAAGRHQSLVVSAADITDIIRSIEKSAEHDSTDSPAQVHIVLHESAPLISTALPTNTQQKTCVEISVLDQILKQLLDGSTDNTGKIALLNSEFSKILERNVLCQDS